MRQWRDAATEAASWMADRGYRDVRVLARREGDVDVRADHAIARVEPNLDQVPRSAIESLESAATVEGKQALCFSYGGYEQQTLLWSASTAVALLGVDPRGRIVALNRRATELADRTTTTAAAPQHTTPTTPGRSSSTTAEPWFQVEIRPSRTWAEDRLVVEGELAARLSRGGRRSLQAVAGGLVQAMPHGGTVYGACQAKRGGVRGHLVLIQGALLFVAHRGPALSASYPLDQVHGATEGGSIGRWFEFVAWKERVRYRLWPPHDGAGLLRTLRALGVAVHGGTESSSTADPSADERRCPGCGARNRTVGGRRHRCGRCGADLPTS